jgi:polysaccharide export outer membrane protein
MPVNQTTGGTSMLATRAPWRTRLLTAARSWRGRTAFGLAAWLFAAGASIAGQAPAPSAAPAAVPTAAATQAPALADYVLGPDDVIALKTLNADEVNGKVRIDTGGDISLPLIGRVTAAGLTIEQLEQALSARLKTYVKNPTVSVTIEEYRSQPVSVIGAVGQPGVRQVQGRKTLVEVLAEAGGLQPEAGNTVQVTRRLEWGPVPVPSATIDPTGTFSIATINLADIMRATRPEENILVKPHDVISIPRAPVVYVIGEVKRPGGFTLKERSSISGLQALAMAEGFTGAAAPQRAVIIRQSDAVTEAREVPVDLKALLAGKGQDVELRPDDILMVPTNTSKNAFTKIAQVAITAATSAVIYRGLY